MTLAQILSAGKFFIERILNFMLLYEFYSYIQLEENSENRQLRIILYWLFMNITSNILITYSSMMHS